MAKGSMAECSRSRWQSTRDLAADEGATIASDAVVPETDDDAPEAVAEAVVAVVAARDPVQAAVEAAAREVVPRAEASPRTAAKNEPRNEAEAEADLARVGRMRRLALATGTEVRNATAPDRAWSLTVKA